MCIRGQTWRSCRGVRKGSAPLGAVAVGGDAGLDARPQARPMTAASATALRTLGSALRSARVTVTRL
jgi:hypothetical protein